MAYLKEQIKDYQDATLQIKQMNIKEDEHSMESAKLIVENEALRNKIQELQNQTQSNKSAGEYKKKIKDLEKDKELLMDQIKSNKVVLTNQEKELAGYKK